MSVNTSPGGVGAVVSSAKRRATDPPFYEGENTTRTCTKDGVTVWDSGTCTHSEITVDMRLRALEELAAEAQELDMGYGTRQIDQAREREAATISKVEGDRS